MTTDKTGAPTTVTAEADRFTIAVDGRSVGLAEFTDRDDQRVFTHTEVADDFEGRGLATFSSPKRCERPAAPGCGSSPSARWWPVTSTSTMSSTMSSTQFHATSSAG